MDEVRAHLTGRHDVRAVQTSYSSGNNAISERTEYEMSEHVAYKMGYELFRRS